VFNATTALAFLLLSGLLYNAAKNVRKDNCYNIIEDLTVFRVFLKFISGQTVVVTCVASVPISFGCVWNNGNAFQTRLL